ncbi:DUF1073 domain [Commensalibacter communis]|uniref:DUF1073 domain n=1 Tax=Commensalibacter communis TaxID=2972786 RepID=A0A9W4XE67_9PROT|nr:DUF1073 domain-containing protein [Commensalibacter communis]CAI3941928.1 DUF1073 domain [Commensalibacter communis]CAI3944696.1 DUF1073 domain [Commensalibacter communis]CAI3958908.1 DUF1073 domain [Commensalibacter communis]CAI3961122.1 DUF1073 domain [Commensalibacter communis]
MFSFFKKKQVDNKTQDSSVSKQGVNWTRSGYTAEKRIAFEEIIKPYEPAPGVIPQAVIGLDSGQIVQNIPDMGMYSEWLDNYYADGLGFFGYPRLSEMAQRPEYRKMVETLAKEATREWIVFKSKSKDKAERIEEIEKEFDRLRVKDIFYKASEDDGFFGLGHILLDFGDHNPSSLIQPIRIDASCIIKGGLKRIVNVEPIWTSPNGYSALDPLDSQFYKPKNWFVNGRIIDSSRILTFVAREVPDLLKPAYNFGGMALTQMAKPYVDNWLGTRRAIADLIKSFSIINFQVSAQQLMEQCFDGTNTPKGIEGLFDRVQGFNQMRHNQGTFVTDKETEDLKSIAVPLGTLDALQAQSQEQMASIAGQPLVKMFGIQPSGLNASSDGEIRVWYDEVSSYQEHFFKPQLERLFQIVQLSLWGEIDPDISFEFVPLWQMDDKNKAEMEFTKAQTDAIYLENSVMTPDEIRQRVANDEDSNYSTVDLTGEAPVVEEPDLMDEVPTNETMEEAST